MLPKVGRNVHIHNITGKENIFLWHIQKITREKDLPAAADVPSATSVQNVLTVQIATSVQTAATAQTKAPSSSLFSAETPLPKR